MDIRKSISNSKMGAAPGILVPMHRLKVALIAMGCLLAALALAILVGLPYLFWGCVPLVGCPK